MATNAITVTRDHRPGSNLQAVARIARRAGAGIADWWSRMATTGQLGQDREREIGRHTGARI